jgi:di/tricarboxylate transporter
MMAASAGFATPIGYQTNLMVYGPGGYKFSDYLRIGVPLDILIGVITVILTPIFFPFHP